MIRLCHNDENEKSKYQRALFRDRRRSPEILERVMPPEEFILHVSRVDGGHPAPRPAVAWYAAVTALCIGGAGRSFQ
jgi:hypothetical protein